MTNQELLNAALQSLSDVVRALVDAPAAIAPEAAPAAPRWIVRLKLGSPATGSMVLGFDETGGTALARRVMMLDADPPAAAVSDALVEICGQAIGGLGQTADYHGIRLVESRVDPAVPEEPMLAGYRMTSGDRLSLDISGWAAAAMDPQVQLLKSSAAPAVSVQNLDVILDIDLPLAVRFGEADLTLRALTRLGPGSIIDLGRSPDDPVDVLVNGKLVARGEVVVVGGNYGVRITELLNASDRMKTVAA